AGLRPIPPAVHGGARIQAITPFRSPRRRMITPTASSSRRWRPCGMAGGSIPLLAGAIGGAWPSMDDAAINQLETALPRMRDRWLGGGDAAQVAPEGWTGSPANLLALAGHALEVLRAPRSAGEMTTRPPLPQLGLPVLTDERRTLLRRAMA